MTKTAWTAGVIGALLTVLAIVRPEFPLTGATAAALFLIGYLSIKKAQSKREDELRRLTTQLIAAQQAVIAQQDATLQRLEALIRD